jgi:hypothetical protein
MTMADDHLLFGYYERVNEGGGQVPSSIGSIETHWCLFCGTDVVPPIPGQRWNDADPTKIHDCTPRPHYPTPPFDATKRRVSDSLAVGQHPVFDPPPAIGRVSEPTDDWDR